ncbi:hypothetical protein E1218_24145 [Kribbella turkmenica]|uniref:Inhibitor I9 domain-containing protein n=1 Tax=Kribbella turkmenica TaxID=2530375 RepID=A0A4R4WJZ6_9ACTN|nr:hypothetical protein [Kribbella turkmenica]TDD19419.1 hypothetical protein E1218_24145 [Kribbella turkmenica]
MARWYVFVVAVCCLLAAAACTPDGGSLPAPTPQENLLSRVPPGGTLPVIVTLEGRFVPEGQLPDEAARGEQRKAISAAQTAVLAELEGFGVTKVRRFAYVPQLALVVDAAALRQLLGSPRVAAVQQDTAQQAQSG